MRLIDADELGKKAFNAYDMYEAVEDSYFVVSIRDIIKAPTIDAVPVVRCADCRHFKCNLRPDGYLPEGVGETECALFYCGMDYTDFCSHGEQKGGDE